MLIEWKRRVWGVKKFFFFGVTKVIKLLHFVRDILWFSHFRLTFCTLLNKKCGFTWLSVNSCDCHGFVWYVIWNLFWDFPFHHPLLWKREKNNKFFGIFFSFWKGLRNQLFQGNLALWHCQTADIELL